MTEEVVMAKITVGGETLEAVEGPCRLKIWPPEALGKIEEAVKRRMAVTATELALAYAKKGNEKSKRRSGRKRTSAEVRERWALGSAWDLPKGGEEW